MKRILAVSLLAFLSAQAHAKCADRYYYYHAKPLPIKVKSWQIYEDRSLEISKEIKDFQMMNAACSEAPQGESHNFTAYFNYIVPADLWAKLDNPLYKNLSIRLPDGALGNGTATIMTINQHEQEQRQAFKQYSSESTLMGKTSALYVYIVREGVDKMYTPQLNVSYSKPLKLYGYYFTEYKP